MSQLTTNRCWWVVLAKTKRELEKPSEQINYSLFNQKITFDFLKSHLWSAADILRGSLDYRQPIMTILFLKKRHLMSLPPMRHLPTHNAVLSNCSLPLWLVLKDLTAHVTALMVVLGLHRC